MNASMLRSARRRRLAGTILALAAALARTSHASGPDATRFSLVPNPAFVRCLAAFPDDPSRPPSAIVTVRRGRLNDQMEVSLRNVKPGLAFDLFTVERTPFLVDGDPDPDFQPKGFGLAWYQSDLEVRNDHRNETTIRTVLLDQIFGLDSSVGLAPTNTFHVGFWFDAPADAAPCGFAGAPTPFNGRHDAGPLAMISLPDAKTNLGPLCANPDLSTDPVRCNP